MKKAMEGLAAADPVLAELIRKTGPYRIRYLEPDYEALAKAIIYQQLSGRVASVIFERLRQAAGNGRLTADSVLRLTPAQLRSLGLSRQKIAYLKELAAQHRSGEVDFAAMRRMEDGEVIRALTQLKGVGLWTAHMFLIFALRRKDVLPSGDLGIRAAVQKAYGLPQLPSPAEVEAIGERWRPWRTVASWYLWRSLEPDANL
ncbi:MAG: DNA-3-methyladenine glycosylase 2 family protein [Bryobacteraceae bacterium]|nr:DNA-3-methyladenine glycosylase 2 family protein [Bryobacteraceae bacterium]